jgi:hypothetical protein
MPSPWHLPRWRSFIMQLVMCAVLGASIGFAALLDDRLRRAQIVDLSSEITEGPLNFKLPDDWKTWSRQAEGDAVVHFASSSYGHITRTITVLRQRVNRMMSPGEYIVRTFPLPPRNSGFGGATIDGWPAQIVSWETISRLPGGTAEPRFAVFCATVLPGNQAISIRLEKTDPLTAPDRNLFRQLLAEMHISLPHPSHEGSVELAGNIRVELPPDFELYPQIDPLQTSRCIVRLTPDGGWILAQLIPTLRDGASSLGESGPSVAMETALAAREQIDPHNPTWALAWLGAQTTHEADNSWLIDPQDPGNSLPQRQAHFIAGPGSSGLLVVLTAQSPAGGNEMNDLWQRLFGGIHFLQPADLKSALLAGGHLMLGPLNLDAPDSWWLWSVGALPEGYSHSFARRDPSAMLRYTVRRNWNGTATSVAQQWPSTKSGIANQAHFVRSDAERDPNSIFFPFIEELTTGGPTILMQSIVRGEQVGDTFTPNLPATFILSQHLPDLLDHLGNEPAAFWTDRLPGIEQERLASPILLSARRISVAAPLQCVETEVNGLGEASRWYFKADGSLDHADFAGDRHLRVSDQNELESIFSGDPRLTPHAP